MASTLPPRRSALALARRRWLAASLVAVAGACSAAVEEQPPRAASAPTPPAAAAPADAAPAPVTPLATAAGTTITVYKSPSCGCCKSWVEHMEQHGYTMVVHDTEAMAPVKAELGVPDSLGSCHTATVGNYVLEGHVPAADVDRLLRERPAVLGLAVPGMPVGSPGMEMPGTPADRYDVVSFERGSGSRVFASH